MVVITGALIGAAFGAAVVQAVVSLRGAEVGFALTFLTTTSLLLWGRDDESLLKLSVRAALLAGLNTALCSGGCMLFRTNLPGLGDLLGSLVGAFVVGFIVYIPLGVAYAFAYFPLLRRARRCFDPNEVDQKTSLHLVLGLWSLALGVFGLIVRGFPVAPIAAVLSFFHLVMAQAGDLRTLAFARQVVEGRSDYSLRLHAGEALARLRGTLRDERGLTLCERGQNPGGPFRESTGESPILELPSLGDLHGAVTDQRLAMASALVLLPVWYFVKG